MKKYLVIGNPINHSLSPKLQNWWLKENNINATYDKIKLEDHEIKNFIQTIKEQKIAGCNVTVPFKKTVIPLLDKLSPEAEQTQSVNTITFEDGDLVGHNTDIAGFDSAIRKLNFSVNGKKVLILGAGGVVPSIIFALQNMNVQEITISNRTKKKAENLRVLFNDLKILDWGNLTDFNMIINATSLGLNNEKINLNFIFCNNQTLNDFKLKYFNDDVLTDIVTFPIRNDSELEAEIYISHEMAIQNAKEFKVSLNNEISRLIVHGILHLIGFNDTTKEKKKEMFEKQEQVISSFNKKLCDEV